MNKKTRDKWGTNEDWLGFWPSYDHLEWNTSDKCYAAILHWTVSTMDKDTRVSLTHYAPTPEEARRVAVELFCKNSNMPLPWRPDYDLSTEEGCRAAISACGYIVELPTLKAQHKVYGSFYKELLDAPLFTWQRVAQWCIDNHSEDK